MVACSRVYSCFHGRTWWFLRCPWVCQIRYDHHRLARRETSFHALTEFKGLIFKFLNVISFGRFFSRRPTKSVKWCGQIYAPLGVEIQITEIVVEIQEIWKAIVPPNISRYVLQHYGPRSIGSHRFSLFSQAFRNRDDNASRSDSKKPSSKGVSLEEVIGCKNNNTK